MYMYMREEGKGRKKVSVCMGEGGVEERESTFACNNIIVISTNAQYCCTYMYIKIASNK